MAMVVTFGGPIEYTDQVWDDVDIDVDGYVLILGGAAVGQEAWYRVDADAETISTDEGAALPAEYVGDHKPAP